mmetsp:Transcript_66215/g.183344  ORF Transcript_66215/g.183344 Transcript_66215/m.183344 type:complete len:612 (-) Transcript_66215:284-2119(-)
MAAAAMYDALEAMDAMAQPLQVVRLDMSENRVTVRDDSLDIITKNLEETKADAVCVVAIMGTYRTGKSFLLDLLMRYLRRWESSVATLLRRKEHEAESTAKITENKGHEAEAAAGTSEAPFPPPRNERWRMKGSDFPPPDWTRLGGSNHVGGFEWRAGPGKCTEGVWLWSRPFVLPFEGRMVAVLLMDTQGAWDGTMTKEQNATIFGLTALMASKLICNAQNRLTDDKIDAIDYFTTFAQAACSGFEVEGAPFGHLEFLIRDWCYYKKGSGYDDCRAMMTEHLNQFLHSAAEGRRETSDRLLDVFRSISCSGLPHPGLAVTDQDFRGEFEAISSDFFQVLDEFARCFFQAPDFPKPSAPLGIEVTPSTFGRVLRNFVQAFADSKGSAVHLREAFVQVELFKHRDLLLDQCRKRLRAEAPESRPLDPELLSQRCARMMADYTWAFETKIRPFRVQDEPQQLQEFRDAVGQVLNRRCLGNASEIEAARFKLVAAPAVAGGVYFMTGHPYIDAGILSVLAFLHVQRRKADMHKESIVDREVCMAVLNDIKKFCENRVRDAHAISIAAQRCTPQSAMEQVVAGAGTAASMARSLPGAAASSAHSLRDRTLRPAAL